MCNVGLKGRISSLNLRGILNLDSIERCAQKSRVGLYGRVERMDESSWFSRCRIIEVSDSDLQNDENMEGSDKNRTES